jgi:hypothetical protein
MKDIGSLHHFLAILSLSHIQPMFI